MKRFLPLVTCHLSLCLVALAQLPATTGWYHIPSSTIRSVSPADNFGGFTYLFQAQLHSHVDAWNSGVMDTRRNRLITWGGGHSDYKGNDMYALDLGSLTVSRIFGPTVPVTASGSPETLGTNIPNSRHTYSALAYLENVDKMFSFGGALSADGGFSHHTWLYAFKTGTWQDMSPTGTIPSADPCCPIAVGYDPNTSKVYLQDNSGLYSYNSATNAFTKHSGNGTGYYVNGVINPITKRFFIIGNGAVKYYDISSGSSFVQQTLSTSGTSVINNNAPGLAFDPTIQKIVMWDEGNTIYTLNETSGVWTGTTYSGGPPARGAPAVGTFGRFAYSPKSRGFIEINSVDNDAYFLRTSPIPSPPQIPDLWDEMLTYNLLGWTWTGGQEPSYANVSYSVSDPDIHGETEGDDLWSYLYQFKRTAQPGFIDRANAWATYFKNSYNQCSGSSGRNFCYDQNNFGGDHLAGWGLIDYYNRTGDSSYLTAAINIGTTLKTLYTACPASPCTPYACLPTTACIHYGIRGVGRHLRFATLLAEATGDPQWATLRDTIINLLLTNGNWDAARGMYFLGQADVDNNCGAGCYAAGGRVQSPFQIGILVEGMAQAYRTTGNTTLRDRIVAMAGFVNTYGLDSTYQYSGSTFGIVNGQPWHSYSANCGGSCTFWDPAYTTSLVNTLVYGYKYSGNAALLARAKVFFNRGTKGIYGSVSARQASDSAVGHFIDTTFDTSSGNFYLQYNKGELQYTYLIFENGGAPSADVNPQPGTISVTYPNGGERLSVGLPVKIYWTTNDTGNLKIEASWDNGATYPVVVTASVAASAGTFTWTPVMPRSTQALIKITSLTDGAVVDVSDADFNIGGRYIK